MPALSAATWAALLSAILTGSLAKLIDYRTRTKVKQVDVSSALRDDLFAESRDLRDRLEKSEGEWRMRVERLEAECDKWRQRYYDLLQELNPMRGALRACEEKLKRMEASDLRRQQRESGSTHP